MPIQIPRMPYHTDAGAYPAWARGPETDEERERREASDAAYAKAIADGLSEQKARIASAKAHARIKRIQMGLDPGDTAEDAYERAQAERKARGKRLAKTSPKQASRGCSVARRR